MPELATRPAAPGRAGGADRAGEVLERLRVLAEPGRLEGMARYGIATECAYGVRIPELRALAREFGVDHRLALRLWDSGVHEARILAGMVDDPALVDAAQMDRWAADFDSWDLCDQVCANLFRHTPLAYGKAREWLGAAEPLVKRAGFALIAGLTVQDKAAPDERFAALLPLIAGAADDDRDIVRKGASWALRQIGKRSRRLNARAIETALELQAGASPGARWIGADALRELRGARVQVRLAPVWTRRLRADPVPALLVAGEPSLAWCTRHDLLAEDGDPRELWELPAVMVALRRQRPDGSWRYPGGSGGVRSETDYDQLATYETLLALVAKHRLDMRHPAVRRAADFLLGFQTAEGDLRGIYGSQYSPNYTAAIVAVLLDARHDDPRIENALAWLLSMRQADGGWAIPLRTHRGPHARSFTRAMSLPEPLQPDRTRPSSHLVTGIVLRAIAAHPELRHGPEAHAAATLLASRLFKRDAYPDRRAAAYWQKLRYPFRWTDIVSALDAMLLAGADADDPAVAHALAWLVDRQDDHGLWRSAYAQAADPHIHHWTTYAAARVLERAHGARHEGRS